MPQRKMKVTMMDADTIFSEEGEVYSSSPVQDAKPKRLRRRKPGDLAQLRAVLWGVLLDVETICTDEGTDKPSKLKAAHTLATLAGAYLKVTETHDLVKRIEALEGTVSHESKLTN
jgi:hypothetical protein